MPAFLPGLQLNAAFYHEVVGPLLAREFPGLVYSAALIGYGSDVLGFDTERSTDHGWGPRLWLFLRADGKFADQAAAILAMLRAQLPLTFHGYPTNYARSEGDGVPVMAATDTPPINHEVIVTALPTHAIRHLGFDPLGTISACDWLLAPMQELLELTAGAIFHDGLAYLAPMRERLAWYPDDVWRAMLAAQWQRLSQEEAFVGRCSEVGDALGAAIVTARLVRDLMRLCFLMERRYAPYSKWLGTAFVRWLHAGPALAPILTALLAATDWQTRERHLSAAYEQIAGMHNALALTPTVDPTTRRYFGRPYRVLHAERFAAVLRATLPHDPALREASFIGAIDQFVDSTDVLGHRDRRYHFAALYG